MGNIFMWVFLLTGIMLAGCDTHDMGIFVMSKLAAVFMLSIGALLAFKLV